MRMQVSSKIDRRPRAAKGGPRAADNLVHKNDFENFSLNGRFFNFILLGALGVVLLESESTNLIRYN